MIEQDFFKSQFFSKKIMPDAKQVLDVAQTKGKNSMDAIQREVEKSKQLDSASKETEFEISEQAAKLLDAQGQDASNLSYNLSSYENSNY